MLLFAICTLGVPSMLAGAAVTNTSEIAPGVFMPRVSMGHSDSSTSTSKEVAALFLSVGGRGLDTANSYHNQDQVGAAVKESGLPRADVFVTTKIYCAGNASGAAEAIESDLKQLGLSQVDLLLIHRPYPYQGYVCTRVCTRFCTRVLL